MQRIPKVTRADVERVILRDYPSADPAIVRSILDGYGKDEWETAGRDRVHLAALKLAAGDLGALREQIRISRQDYRDVLSAAEYPMSLLNSSEAGMSDESRERIHNADWKQYQDWLNGRTFNS